MKHIYLAIFLLFCLTLGATGQVRLQGSIYDRATGLPLKGVKISIKDYNIGAISDKFGSFVLDSLEEGVYYIQFFKEGFYPSISDYELKGKKVFSIGISLNRKQSEFEHTSVKASQLVERKPIHSPHAESAYEGWRTKDELPFHVPDMLNSLTGLWSTDLFHGGGNVQLRGLGGNRLPVYLNGMELTSAAAGLDENLSLLTLDPLSLERIEVARGTGSVQYGSDAVNGTVILSSKKAHLSGSGWQVHGSLTGQAGLALSNSGQSNPLYAGGGRAEISLSGPKLGLLVGSSRYGNRNYPFPGGSVDSSAFGRDFEDVDLTIAIDDKNEIQLSYHRGNLRNLNLRGKEEEEALVGGELKQLERQSSQAKYIAYTPDTYLEKVEISIGVQNWNEEVTYQGPEGDWNYEDQLRLFRGDIQVTSQPIPYWQIVSGVSYTQQEVNNSTGIFSSKGNGSEEVPGRLAPNGMAGDFSLFTSHTLDVLKLRLSFGGRAHAYNRQFLEDDFSPVVLVGNISGMYPLHPNYKLYFSSQTGFRAPNLYDYSYQGPMNLGFAAPADSLPPERTFSSEVGLKASTDHFNGSVALYRTQISDFLDWRNARFEGNTTYLGLPVYSIQPTGQAYVQGIEAEVEVIVNTSMVVFGNIAYTYGKNISQTQALPLIPPLNGRLGLRYQSRRGIWSRLEWRYSDRQDRLGFTDLPNPRVNDDGTAAWNVIDFHLGWKHSLGYATLGIKNLLNNTYVAHGAGLPGIGRIVLVSVQLGF